MVAIVAMLAAVTIWFFRGEDLIYEPVPGEGHARIAAYLDQAAEQIVREEHLERSKYCLRVPLWETQFHDGCVLVRAAMVGRWRQCTPFRALNGGCYAIEMRQPLLENKRIHDLLYERSADMCLYTTNPNRRVVGFAQSIDCVSPGAEYVNVRRIEPLLCVFALDAKEEPAAPAFAVRRGRQTQDYWCHEWEKFVQVRSKGLPKDCWLGVTRPAPGGGSFGGCKHEES